MRGSGVTLAFVEGEPRDESVSARLTAYPPELVALPLADQGVDVDATAGGPELAAVRHPGRGTARRGVPSRAGRAASASAPAIRIGVSVGQRLDHADAAARRRPGRRRWRRAARHLPAGPHAARRAAVAADGRGPRRGSCAHAGPRQDADGGVPRRDARHAPPRRGPGAVGERLAHGRDPRPGCDRRGRRGRAAAGRRRRAGRRSWRRCRSWRSVAGCWSARCAAGDRRRDRTASRTRTRTTARTDTTTSMGTSHEHAPTDSRTSPRDSRPRPRPRAPPRRRDPQPRAGSRLDDHLAQPLRAGARRRPHPVDQRAADPARLDRGRPTGLRVRAGRRVRPRHGGGDGRHRAGDRRGPRTTRSRCRPAAALAASARSCRWSRRSSCSGSGSTHGPGRRRAPTRAL